MYYFIVNPNARSGKGRLIWQKVCRIMNEKRLPYEALFTEKKGEAAKLAREAAERDEAAEQNKIIVAMGGDGTISEVLDGIWNHPEVTFAFIPIGSGNDFARGLGISSNWRKALAGILSEKRRIYFHPGRLEYDGRVRHFGGSMVLVSMRQSATERTVCVSSRSLTVSASVNSPTPVWRSSFL